MPPPVAPDIAWLPATTVSSGIGGSSAHLASSTPPTDGPQHCALLGPLSLLVQALMLLLVLSSLVVKRAVEHPKRPWRVFMLDCGKQIVGQGFVHAANLLISSLPAPAPPRRGQVSTTAAVVAAEGNVLASGGPMDPTPPEGVNPCSLYFLNVLIDCTLGVVLIWLFLRAAKYLLVTRLKREGWVMGRYTTAQDGSKLRIDWWAKQCALYVASLVLMKGAVIVIFALLPVIFTFGSWILEWLDPHAQVVFVMALFPLAMNVLQFALIDQLLKHTGSTSATGSPGGSSSYAALPTHTTPVASPSLPPSRTLRREASFTVLASARASRADGSASAAGSPGTAPASPLPRARTNSTSEREAADEWSREWADGTRGGGRPAGGADNNDEEKLLDDDGGLGLDVDGAGRRKGGRS